MARPPKEINVATVQRLAAYDFSLEEMAAVLGVSKSTMYARLSDPKTQKEFEEAIDAGRRDLKAKLKNKIINMALGGNVACLIFLNKNFSTNSETGKAYSDRQNVEVGGAVGVNHNFNFTLSEEQMQNEMREMLKDPDMRQRLLGEGTNNGTVIEAGEPVYTDSTSGEASRDDTTASSRDRSSERGSRTRSKKGARRRNSSRKRTQKRKRGD